MADYLPGLLQPRWTAIPMADIIKAGFQGGVFVNAQLSDLFNAQLEIKYAGKGAKKPVTSTDPDIYTLTLHYIDIPVSGQRKSKKNRFR